MDQFPVTLRPASELKPYERNARTHSPEQIRQLKELILLVGFTNPILADAEGIIAGHGRLAAALELYAEGKAIPGPGKRFELPAGTVPVIDASGMGEAERRAYILADNQVALNSGWDAALVNLEIEGLTALGFDLGAIGFSDGELKAFSLFRDFGETSAAEEWRGMPEFDNPDNCHRKIIVSFGSAEDVAAFAAALKVTLSEKTKSLWYPPKPMRNLEAERWVHGDE